MMTLIMIGTNKCKIIIIYQKVVHKN